jgi:serine/threonine-protein kinase
MATDPLFGSTLGDFEIESALGAGGMGVVYRARDLILDRPVAVKVLAPHLLGDSEARARFQREMTTAAAVEHPYIVPVYNAGYEEGYFFIAMRLVDGPNLADLIGDQPLDVGRALGLFDQIAAGLHWIHREGLVHRDIKPQNVLVSNAGQREEHALLGDFGIARALDSSTGLTKGILGTAEYLAPEVAQWKPATPASDQYALGCVLFEMLTGRSPYRGEDLPAAHIDEPVPRVSDAAPDAPDGTCAAVERALSKDPVDRFVDVREFADAVRTGELPERDPRPQTTLHGELATILQERGNPWLTTADLATAVNERRRYTQHDGSEVTDFQVHGRTRNYPQIFQRDGNNVRLR